MALGTQSMGRCDADHARTDDHNFSSVHGESLNDDGVDTLRQKSASARQILQPLQALGRLALRPHHPDLRLVWAFDFHHDRPCVH